MIDLADCRIAAQSGSPDYCLTHKRPVEDCLDIAKADEAMADYKKNGGISLDTLKEELGTNSDA